MVHKNDDNIEMECIICLKLFTSDNFNHQNKETLASGEETLNAIANFNSINI